MKYILRKFLSIYGGDALSKVFSKHIFQVHNCHSEESERNGDVEESILQQCFQQCGSLDSSHSFHLLNFDTAPANYASHRFLLYQGSQF